MRHLQHLGLHKLNNLHNAEPPDALMGPQATYYGKNVLESGKVKKDTQKRSNIKIFRNIRFFFCFLKYYKKKKKSQKLPIFL